MRRFWPLGLVIPLLLAAATGVGVSFWNQGRPQGQANVINCGSGLLCSLSKAGYIGTISTSGAVAPFDGGFWMSGADSNFPGAKNLGALTTGLVINTTGTPSAYTGTTCSTGNAIQSLNASGAQTGCITPVTGVSGTSPIASSGGATPAISCQAASGAQAGCLSSTDWNTFNNKGPGSWYCDGGYPYKLASSAVSCTPGYADQSRILHSGGMSGGLPYWGQVYLNRHSGKVDDYLAEVTGVLPPVGGGTGTSSIEAQPGGVAQSDNDGVNYYIGYSAPPDGGIQCFTTDGGLGQWSTCPTTSVPTHYAHWAAHAETPIQGDLLTGPTVAAAAWTSQRISCSWEVAASAPSGNVTLGVFNYTDGGELCNCTVGACDVAANVPMSCTCSGTYEAGSTYAVRLNSRCYLAVDSNTDDYPENIMCNVQYSQ